MEIKEPTVTYVPPGEGEALWFVGQLITYKVRGDGEGVTIFELTVGPYGGAPAHMHRTQDETHYILEGQFKFVCGDQTIAADPGSVVHVPRAVCHAFTNLGPGPGRILFVTTHPGPLERFYDEAGEPAIDRSAPPPHPANMERILTVARQTGGLDLVLPEEAHT